MNAVVHLDFLNGSWDFQLQLVFAIHHQDVIDHRLEKPLRESGFLRALNPLVQPRNRANS
jgi:hypothetical protein